MTARGSTPPIAASHSISGLIIISAMILQETLTRQEAENIPTLTLQHALAQPVIQVALAHQWHSIAAQHNSHPIFHLALEILHSLPVQHQVDTALRSLAQLATEIAQQQTALHHDLMGRIYHRLLADARYLGTYYTRIPAAALLLKLALHPPAWQIAWHDPAAIAQLRIADLACGTGTLLATAADTITDSAIRAAVCRNQPVDLATLHQTLHEHVLYGYDVLPSAIHLTAATLALRTPQARCGWLHLYSLPHGGSDHRLGSLEFLKGHRVDGAISPTPNRQAQQREGMHEQPTPGSATLPLLDLCVINPPFTRSVGGNLLFGSVSGLGRTAMKKALKTLLRQQSLPASITAGLGALFVALADRALKLGGRLALVLPKALLSGAAWKKTRTLLAQNYHIEYLIASHDPTRWNFSESTGLSEVMLVAHKQPPPETDPATASPPAPPATTVINLWHNPATTTEAWAIAHQVSHHPPPDLLAGHHVLHTGSDTTSTGAALSVVWPMVRDNWMLPCAFAQPELIRAAYHLIQGHLWLPGSTSAGSLTLAPLSSMGSIGPDRRGVHNTFALSTTPTRYRAFWGHHAAHVTTLAQQPGHHLAPREPPQTSNTRDARLWSLAGTLLLAERLRLNTQRLVAVRLSDPALSNVWWTLLLNPALHPNRDTLEKALALWFNSTLGLLLLLAHREETEGAWIGFKKTRLAELPVLNLAALSSAQLHQLASHYDQLCQQPLRPFAALANDPLRARIDHAIVSTLDLPDCSPLRTLLAREPIVRLRRVET